MRKTDIKELLTLLLEQIQSHPSEHEGCTMYSGMCVAVTDLRVSNKIIPAEEMTLELFLKEHQPKDEDMYFDRIILEGGNTVKIVTNFWWKPYLMAPRVQWLKERIDEI